MKINIGLSDEARLAVGQILNLLLADEYVLYATTHDYHWNVVGPNFLSLHLLFETQYGHVHLLLDDIAERARAVGVGARGNWNELAKSARISAKPGIGLSPDEMLAGLLTMNENLAVQLRNDTVSTEKLGDIGTTDFLTSLLKYHEKAAWMLRSHAEAKASALV
jgi:starvation-inducible DNA-binding protein